MSEALAVEKIGPHQTLQYSSPAHQEGTAVAGMWLFVASETLFFGALFLCFVWVYDSHPAGYALAARHTNLWIGSINTAVLLTSSLVFSLGLAAHKAGSRSGLLMACAITAALGVAFIVLKGLEWSQDFDEHLFPGGHFGLTGADAQGAQLFYSLYFLGTALHGVHLLIGLALLALLAWRAWRRQLSGVAGTWTTPVEVTGLYWSFVDMVWLVLFPLIYVLGRAS